MNEAIEVGVVLVVLCLGLGRLAIGPIRTDRTDDDH